MPKNQTMVRGGVLITAHDASPAINAAVVVEGGKIKEVGSYDQLAPKYPQAKQLGGPEFMIIPGLLNGHSHGRGLSDFQRGGLDNTLETWRFCSAKYTPVATYDDVAFSAIRLLKSGVTATMHNHLLRNPALYRSEFDQAIQAYAEAGMRVLFCPGIKNANPFVYGDNKAFLAGLPGKARAFFTPSPPSPEALSPDNYLRVVGDLYQRHQSDMIRIGMGPVAPQWCTDDLLRLTSRGARELGIPLHIHVLQTVFQKRYGLKEHGQSLIAHLEELGFLGEGVVLGHCVFPTQEDIQVLARTGTGVTHHPTCNLRQRNGIAPVFAMLEAGMRVGLGMDGKSINDDDDMLQEMRVCSLLHRLPSLELDSPCLSSRQVLKMATENNAFLLGYGQELGRLEPGRFADLVLLDYPQMTYPYTSETQDPIDVLLYRGRSRHVKLVMVNGRVVVKNGQVLTINEEKVAARLAEAASRPRTEAEKEYLEAIDVLRAHVQKFFQGWSQEAELDPFYLMNSRRD